MAGDWIKLEHATPDKPEVIAIADALGMEDHDLAWAKCVRLWIWLDQQCTDGNGISVTDSFIDRFTRVTGFSKALRKVGWLDGRDGRLSVPNFERHNGKSAKTRANTAKRVQKTREKSNACSVTEALPEKRREEKRKIHTHTHAEGFENEWDRWLAYRESVDPRPLSPIQADAVLLDLCRRGADKAIRDIDFSIRKGAKSILDSDHDFEKKRGSPTVGGKGKRRKTLEELGL